MYKVQYKRNSPYDAWTAIGSYTSEQSAISVALQWKNKGVALVRVTDKKGMIIYTG
jgi:hypothetical protein